MDRRKFFKSGSLLALGTALFNPLEMKAENLLGIDRKKNKKLKKAAKNIIFLVSDGMSTGTLNMADLYLNRKMGHGSNWLNLYREEKVQRALMDTASLSSIVTDSSAGSSSWGGGHRVNNGVLNVGPNGENYMPIWQKFKKAGKMAGCVTTVPITHATPAGFCVNNKSRNGMEEIAEQYLELNFDIMMGGGNKYFSADYRSDKKDIYANYTAKGYQVVKNKSEMESASLDKPILGVFADEGLPYDIDRQNIDFLRNNTPTLAQMAQKAIDRMKNNPKGFVLQIEAGKVDWAAHANDISALINDQIAFDEAVKVAIDFAEKDKNTLVIITTDHGNANPGVIYGKEANHNFDSLHHYKFSNDYVLNQITKDSSVSSVQELLSKAMGSGVKEEDAKTILGFYTNIKMEDGLYNPKHLPYKALADMQKPLVSVGWISQDHSADYVELAMYGPGSELLKPFVKNIDLHYLMLDACEVENKF